MSECCAMCGATENLQVHHISYKPEVTQTLCVERHQKQHPNHGVGPSSGNGYHPLFDELKEEFLLLSEGGTVTRKMVVEKLGISYMTAYLWDKMLGIKRKHVKVRKSLYMNKNDYTNIRLKKETAKMLHGIGKKSETYDDVILRLIEER